MRYRHAWLSFHFAPTACYLTRPSLEPVLEHVVVSGDPDDEGRLVRRGLLRQNRRASGHQRLIVVDEKIEGFPK
jgi:hypothetical protein